ncbi:lipocalin-like domain-containing protein [Acetobacter okinawensis]|uniref:lipocalin-like domain-containing protein n=1 Tax=Acetobacter okinawensis TaxID=1076594 RepID=UPI000B336557|nr:lipocalin-like domain-containing protein [Acetobacter okinawensis]
MPMQATAQRIMDNDNELPCTKEEALRQNLIGTWELVSYKVEEKETGNFINAMGCPAWSCCFYPRWLGGFQS